MAGNHSHRERAVPLAVSGSRAAPDAAALENARALPASYAAWREEIARALLEHYMPYAESVTSGDAGPPESGLPRIDTPADIWAHTRAAFVQVAPLDGTLTVEIGYRVAWDEEHTVAARLRGGASSNFAAACWPRDAYGNGSGRLPGGQVRAAGPTVSRWHAPRLPPVERWSARGRPRTICP